MRSATFPLDVELQLIDLGSKTGRSTQIRMTGADKVVPSREYDGVVLFNPNVLPVAYEITGGDGDYDRPIPDLVNVAVSTPASDSVETEPDVTISGVTNATRDVIIAANANRTRVIITALAANDQTVRIGGADVDADEGIPLAPGESVALATTAQIEGVEEVLGTNKVSVFEETIS